MTEKAIHFILILSGLIAAFAVFTALFFVSAPYGRHIRKGWGPAIPSALGWMVMEAPASLLFAVYFFIGSLPKNLPLIVFFIMWELHYVHRAFIYPLTIRDSHKQMPVAVVAMALIFNIGNTYINGRYLFSLSGGYPINWLTDPRFILGAALFVSGYLINRWADYRLRRLRKPGETGYLIPTGGLFGLISCPNYFGEIIEWAGWAVATWSLPGLAFAVWTFANLAPRARSHHAWYHSHFKDYPADRKALIPWLW